MHPSREYCPVVIGRSLVELDRYIKLRGSLNVVVRFIADAKRDEHIIPYYHRQRQVESRRRYFMIILILFFRQSVLRNKLLR